MSVLFEHFNLFILCTINACMSIICYKEFPKIQCNSGLKLFNHNIDVKKRNVDIINKNMFFDIDFFENVNFILRKF